MAEVLIEQASDGAATQSGPSALTANTSTLAAAANASRDRLIISAGVADVWLGYGQTAVVGKGHVVRAGGAPFEERAWKGVINMVSSGAAVVGLTETSFGVGGDAQGEAPPGANAFAPTGPSDNYWQTARATAPPPGTPIT